jgi:hypothetical protein
MADVAILEMTLPRDGAKALSTPIWIPNAPRFAKPQRAYVVMVKARGDNGSSLCWIAERSSYTDIFGDVDKFYQFEFVRQYREQRTKISGKLVCD